MCRAGSVCVSHIVLTCVVLGVLTGDDRAYITITVTQRHTRRLRLSTPPKGLAYDDVCAYRAVCVECVRGAGGREGTEGRVVGALDTRLRPDTWPFLHTRHATQAGDNVGP
jgi:hypothetical protein